jgi:hypothetical protein
MNLKEKETKIRAEVQSFTKFLQKTAENPSIFDASIKFRFSNLLKHEGITVVSENLLKSTQGYKYTFGLLEPSLQ